MENKRLYEPKFYTDEYLKNKSGIYQIRNLVNNKIYIGSSKNLYKRKVNHFYELRLNKHCNAYLQNSYNFYSEENFIFEVIEFIEDENNTLKIEQYWLDRFFNKEFCYNINPNANRPHILKGKLNHNYGKPPWNKGLKLDEKMKLKFKKPKTLEHRKKLSEKAKLRLANPENHPLYNKHHTEESKQKMRGERPSIQGEKHPFFGKFGGKSSNHVKIICLELNKIYEAITEASRDLEASAQCISDCCRNKYNKTICKKIKNSPKLHFMYYSDYIKSTPQQIQDKLNS